MGAPGPPAEPNEGSGCVCQRARPLSCWQRRPRAAQGPPLLAGAFRAAGSFSRAARRGAAGGGSRPPLPFFTPPVALTGALSRCRGCVWDLKWGCACSRWEPRGGLAWASTCSLCSSPRAACYLFIFILAVSLRLSAVTFLLPFAWCRRAVRSCQPLREQVKHHGAALEVGPAHLELVNAACWEHFGSSFGSPWALRVEREEGQGLSCLSTHHPFWLNGTEQGRAPRAFAFAIAVQIIIKTSS